MEKNSSPHTIVKYKADLTKLSSYLKNNCDIQNPGIISISYLREYIEYIKDKNNLSSTSVANKIAVIKSFFKYLHDNVYSLLEEYSSQRLPLNCSALIIGEQGKRLSTNSLILLFKKYIILSGLSGKGYTLHSLRHLLPGYLIKM